MALFNKFKEKEKLIRQFRLQVKTEIEALNTIFEWFDRIARSFLLSQELSWQCRVALAEGFANTVLHAHQDLPPTTAIDLEIKLLQKNLQEKWLEIRIWDWGKPFDLKNKLQSLSKNTPESLERERGRGLQFIACLSDDFDYIRVDRRNCLLIRKKLN